jgi:hypothetical protein
LFPNEPAGHNEQTDTFNVLEEEAPGSAYRPIGHVIVPEQADVALPPRP